MWCWNAAKIEHNNLKRRQIATTQFLGDNNPCKTMRDVEHDSPYGSNVVYEQRSRNRSTIISEGAMDVEPVCTAIN